MRLLRRLFQHQRIIKMSEVVKSPNDRRDYRAIQLKNGLRALLISDMVDLQSGSEVSCGQYAGKDHDKKTDLKKKMSTEKPSGGEKLSAAALCIGTGSFSDPVDIPGLAHFLEHMVFMGSEKYPEENDFDAFIKKHGGNDNAHTDTEKTLFYFDIQKEFFYEALDKFAQFFISPLLKKSSVDREINAVDSEFELSIPTDTARKEQLLGSFSKDGHPMGKFMWGNKESLSLTPERQGIDIYDRLVEFRKSMYSSHYMTLVVQSKDPLESLESWVTEIFSAIPNNQMEKPDFTDLKEPFDPEKFCKLYKVVPVKNIHEVELTWSLPSLLHYYRVKPLHYVGWLVGHEGKGSILPVLREKLWATSISSGNSETGFEHNTACAIFSICVTLTDEGIDHVYEVLVYIFKYLDMLRRIGPQQRIFDEIKTIENNEFLWQEQYDPIDYVENLCENVQLYPVENYLTGDRLLFEYDEEIIRECQNLLVPERANMIILSKNHEAECDTTEYWYKTKYTCSDVPKEWLESFRDLDTDPALHLPEENKYIASDFSIKPYDEETINKAPVTIIDEPHSRLWFKKDTKFKVPKAYIYYHFMSSVVSRCPKNMALLDMYLKVLAHNMSEVTYAADVAQLSYSFCSRDSGFTLKLSGFNHKLPKLFEVVIEHMGKFSVSEGLFHVVHSQMRKIYHNQFIKSSKLVRDVRLGILLDKHWGLVDRYTAMVSLTRDDLVQFAEQLFSSVFVEGYIHGNFTREEAKEMHTYLLGKMQPSCFSEAILPELLVVKLPVGQRFCRVQNMNREDKNSSITNYYQSGPATVYEAVLNEFMMMRMEEPCFDILRTREQLGYSVFCTNHITSGILGMSVTVCSQADKFSMEVLHEKMENFLVEFKELIYKMTDEEFAEQVNALRTLKQCEDTHLGEEVDRHWNEILVQNYLFDRLEKEVAILEKLSLEEVCNWYQNYINKDGECYRKLSVQIVGSDASSTENDEKDSDEEDEDEGESEDEESEDDETGSEDEEPDGASGNQICEMIFPPVEDAIQKDTISSISSFKQTLSLFPRSKIV